jgi:hypothetical protein
MVQINELLRFRTKSNHGELAKKIYSALPQPTPPESSLRMRKQEISFVLSR